MKSGRVMGKDAITWQVVLFLALQVVHKIALSVLTRERTAATLRRGYATTFLLAITFFVPLAAAIFRLASRDNPVSDTLFIPVAIMVAAGVGLRIWGLMHLRHYFSELIVIREDHRLITTGPYRVLRHPLHVGLLIQIVGFAFVAGYWWAWAFAALTVVVIIPRELTEERTLGERFGDDYDAFRRRTFGFTDLLPGQRPRHGNA